MVAGPRPEPRWSNRVDTPVPVRGRRLSGEHWWDPDRIAHMDDAPAYCPSCGGRLDGHGSLAVEYWEGEKRIYHTRCDRCSWSGDIIRIDRMIGPEAPQ